MKRMRISKIQYENYMKWQEQRYKYLEVRETPFEYKGGKIYISGVIDRRAIKVNVYYKNIGYCKIFDVPCDRFKYGDELTYEMSLRDWRVKAREMYTWRDAETYNLALEFGRGIIDGWKMLEEATNAPNYGFRCKPIDYKIIADCEFVEDEQINRGTETDIK